MGYEVSVNSHDDVAHKQDQLVDVAIANAVRANGAARRCRGTGAHAPTQIRDVRSLLDHAARLGARDLADLDLRMLREMLRDRERVLAVPRHAHVQRLDAELIHQTAYSQPALFAAKPSVLLRLAWQPCRD
mgnify:CR=1 FL=1